MRNCDWVLKVGVFVFGSLCLSSSYSAAQTSVAPETGQTVPLFDGLGDFGRTVTTHSKEAQRYFNQGLCFLYAFNHDEAIRSFSKAAELDPQCAMAWWGIALANGPHINNPFLPPDRAEQAWKALSAAKASLTDESEIEKALIEALAARYTEHQPEDRKPLDQAYADAMRQVWKTHPQDADVGALFAESMMDLRPWDLWTAAGEAQPGTDEIVATLEKVLELNPRHPLALHLYIHAVEASPQPEKADEEADRLRDLQPGLGHLVHMPSHIDVRRGRWLEAAVANQKAIEADKAYRARAPGQDFYRVYMAHNHHMLAYAAMMRGQRKLAITAVEEMVQSMPQDWIDKNAVIADGFTAMPFEVLVRFGQWEEVLATAQPAENLPLARCLWHCARGIAHASLGNVDQARGEKVALDKAAAALPETSMFGNNKGHDLVGVAQRLLAGEVLYREGKPEEALLELREAVAREDKLRYSEPPDWIHPVRHALGATLLELGRFEEAIEVYEQDLRRQPENGWSLLGMAKALRGAGKRDESEAAMARFNKAWADADVKISSSCLCLPGR